MTYLHNKEATSHEHTHTTNNIVTSLHVITTVTMKITVMAIEFFIYYQSNLIENF
jgi:hypothetical protein